MPKAAKRAKAAKRDAAVLPVGGYCETCAWWDTRRKTMTYELEAGLGVCRWATPMVGCDPGWAVTCADDWCREYERETVWDEARRDVHVV